MKYLLDTNVCIRYLNGESVTLGRRLQSEDLQEMAVCSVVKPHDLLIASIAIANNLTLVTHNTGEFSRVEGLEIEDWEVSR